MIRSIGPFLALTMRIALSAWFLLATVATFLGLVIDVVFPSDMSLGLSSAFLFTLIVFPPAALLWGLWCAWRQRSALAKTDIGLSLLSVGSRKSINIECSNQQTLLLAESALRSVFVASRLQVNDLGIAARISDIDKSNALWPWRYEDNIAFMVSAEGEERSVLQIAIDPTHAWIYGLFAVDGGRSAQRMRKVEIALQRRIRAQSVVVDEMRHQESARARLSEAQLAVLRAHIEPHFIFNTLAHVKAGLGPNSETAAVMLDALIEFLRRNSRALNRHEATLREELAIVESYLRIIGLRLGRRLRYDLDCPPKLLERMVPVACILVLVENAIKHGIERSLEGGRVVVQCDASNDVLQLNVRNDGPPFGPMHDRQGGLGNLQDRLRLMYGTAYTMEIEDIETGGVLVALTLPSEAA